MIVPRLPEFLLHHPSLDIDVILDDRVIDLVSEGIDIALRLGTLADSTAVARKIASSGRSVVATPALSGPRAGIPKAPADLVHHHAVVYSQVGDNWTFRQGNTEVSVAVRGRLRVSAAEGTRAAVLADMGLAVASDWMFAPELASGAVQRVLPEWTLPPIDLWAVFPTGRLPNARARAFADLFDEPHRPHLPSIQRRNAERAIKSLRNIACRNINPEADRSSAFAHSSQKSDRHTCGRHNSLLPSIDRASQVSQKGSALPCLPVCEMRPMALEAAVATLRSIFTGC